MIPKEKSLYEVTTQIATKSSDPIQISLPLQNTTPLHFENTLLYKYINAFIFNSVYYLDSGKFSFFSVFLFLRPHTKRRGAI